MDKQSLDTLQKLFMRHRLVFWYDDKGALREEYEALSLEGVTKLEIVNNEFALKYHILREEPDRKFLLYQASPQPPDDENWLLDLLLSSGEFRTDRTAILLSELDMDISFQHVIKKHAAFFDSKARIQQLKKLSSKSDSSRDLQTKLLAVCCGNDSGRLDESLMALLAEGIEGGEDRFNLVARCNLTEHLWEEIKIRYGYVSGNPSLFDFAFEVFQFSFERSIGLFDEEKKLSTQASLFLKQWKDSKTYNDSFVAYSKKLGDELNIPSKLQALDFKAVIDCDLFESIDTYCIIALLEQVKGRTASHEEISQWIRSRRGLQWYEKYQYHYEALEAASALFTLLGEVNLSIQSLSDGIHRYSTSWYQVDARYREFITQVGKTGPVSLFSELITDVENHYTNNFLVPLNDSWYLAIERGAEWGASNAVVQNRFYERYVKPLVDKDIKVCVIISDGLRYEVGEELSSRIEGLDRHSATVEPMLTMLPSYTQLGMAALLPSKELTFAENGIVLADGKSTVGRENREKVLKSALDGKAVAFDAETINNTKVDDLKTIVRDNKVIYVYHDVIDKIGDARDSEERVFGACETALDEISKLVRKFTSSNALNVIVTSDHGFIYQNRPVEESSFVALAVSKEGAINSNRRFLVGKDLADNPSLLSFTAPQIGLTGDFDIQVARGVSRMLEKGSGSRYVHGGASLQEVVVPVVKINKGRTTDVSNVEVDVIVGENRRITSGQLGVTFYQAKPVSDKVKPVKVKAGIYTLKDKLISESHELMFDFESENPREREEVVSFRMHNSPEAMTNQQVELRLEIPIENTNKWKVYKKYSYALQRMMVTDF